MNRNQAAFFGVAAASLAGCQTQPTAQENMQNAGASLQMLNLESEMATLRDIHGAKTVASWNGARLLKELKQVRQDRAEGK